MIRIFVLAILGSLLLSQSCWAFSWSNKINQRVNNLTPTAPSQINGNNLGPSLSGLIHYFPAASLSSEEIETVLFNQEVLKNYGQRPDCFRRAAGLIRTRCGELDMNEDERVKAAISMTLCELATAKHHSIPFECVPYTADSAPTSRGPHSQVGIVRSPEVHSFGPVIQGIFVKSLSFVLPSGAGTILVIPPLLPVVKFPKPAISDTAREIYRNITMEKAVLIQLIIAREKSADLTLRNWENHLRNLQEMISRMQTTAGNLDAGVQDLHHHLAREFDNVLGELRDAVIDLGARQADHAYSLFRQTQTSLAGITQNHSRDLQQLISPLELSLIDRIDLIFVQSRNDNRVSLDLANEAQQRWVDFTGQIGSLTHSITILSSTASEIASIVNDSTQQASHLHRLHHETSDSASQLAETVMHLTVTTHAELEKINASAAFIQERLLFQGYGTVRLLTRVLKFFLPADPETLSHFTNLPVFRIILTLIGLVRFSCRFVLSGITAAIFIAFSYRRCLTDFVPYFAKSKLSLQPSTSPLDPSCCFSYSPPSLYHSKQAPDPAAPTPRYQRLRASRIPERLLRATT